MELPTRGGSRHFQLSGALGAGEAVEAAGVVRQVIPVSGFIRGKLRAKLSTAGGTVAFYFKRPSSNGQYAEDGTLRHAADEITDLALADTNEAVREFDLYGEGALEIEYTDDGSGGSVIDYFVVSLV